MGDSSLLSVPGKCSFKMKEKYSDQHNQGIIWEMKKGKRFWQARNVNRLIMGSSRLWAGMERNPMACGVRSHLGQLRSALSVVELQPHVVD